MRVNGDTLHLDGPVTIETVPALIVGAREACGAGVVHVDFAAVTEVDSTAIAFALELQRDAQSRNAALRFHAMPAALLKLIDLYAVADHLATA